MQKSFLAFTHARRHPLASQPSPKQHKTSPTAPVEIAQLSPSSLIGIPCGFQEVLCLSLPSILNRPCQSISSMHFRRCCPFHCWRMLSDLLLLKVASFQTRGRKVVAVRLCAVVVICVLVKISLCLGSCCLSKSSKCSSVRVVTLGCFQKHSVTLMQCCPTFLTPGPLKK